MLNPNFDINSLFFEYINNTKYERFDILECLKNMEDNKKHKNINNYILKIINEICGMYCEWINDDVFYEHVSDGNPYDYSGDLKKIEADKLYKLKKFESINEWLEECHTGDKEATYCSGFGFRYLTFEYKIFELLSSAVHEYLVKEMGADDEKDFWFEEYEDVEDELRGIMEYSSKEILQKIPILQCWFDYNYIIKKNVEILEKNRKKQQEEDFKLEKISIEILNDFFPELKKIKKMTIGNSKDFFEKLEKIKPNFDKKDINALTRFPLKNKMSHGACSKYFNILHKK
jgi:hypothetical protein